MKIIQVILTQAIQMIRVIIHEMMTLIIAISLSKAMMTIVKIPLSIAMKTILKMTTIVVVEAPDHTEDAVEIAFRIE